MSDEAGPSSVASESSEAKKGIEEAEASGSEHSESRNSSPEAEEQDETKIAAAGAWQAIFSPQHNAYYFYNSETQETTWSNPLEPEKTGVASNATASDPPATPASEPTEPPQSAAGPSSSSVPQYNALQQAAISQGIDPGLAYLDPSLAGSSSNPDAFTYTAKFNARTGAFAKVDARNPSHLSEFERAKRMSQMYFDVGAWEKEVEERKRKEADDLESGRDKKKKLTKKDIVREITSAGEYAADHDNLNLGTIQRAEETEEVG